METEEKLEFEEKLKPLFGDRVVEKGLARDEAFFRLPRYVTEYLIAKYVKPESASQDIERLKSQIRDHLPDLDRRELIKDSLMRDGHYTLIDSVEVRVEQEVAPPGVQHHGHSHLGAQPLGVQAALLQGLPSRLEQQPVERSPVPHRQRAKLGRQREHLGEPFGADDGPVRVAHSPLLIARTGRIEAALEAG